MEDSPFWKANQDTNQVCSLLYIQNKDPKIDMSTEKEPV